jgi:hypothetical protein
MKVIYSGLLLSFYHFQIPSKKKVESVAKVILLESLK